MAVEFYVDPVNEHRFRIKGDNGEIVALGEGYTRADDAMRGYATLERIVTQPARDALLNMIADSRRFDEDPDDGQCDYHMTVGHTQLAELANALGIESRIFETIGETLKYRIAEDAATDKPDRGPQPGDKIEV